MINMLRAQIENLNMEEQMGSVKRQMESLRQNQKEMPDIKNTITEMKKTFDGFIS